MVKVKKPLPVHPVATKTKLQPTSRVTRPPQDFMRQIWINFAIANPWVLFTEAASKTKQNLRKIVSSNSTIKVKQFPANVFDKSSTDNATSQPVEAVSARSETFVNKTIYTQIIWTEFETEHSRYIRLPSPLHAVCNVCCYSFWCEQQERPGVSRPSSHQLLRLLYDGRRLRFWSNAARLCE